MTTFIVATICLILGYILIKPFIGISRVTQADWDMNLDVARSRLLDQKERLLSVMNDLELDSKMDKVATEDFNKTQKTLVSELDKVSKSLGES